MAERVSTQSLHERVTVLEAGMSAVKQDVATMKVDVQTVKDNSNTILDIITKSKTLAGYAKRYAPPVIAFLIGAGYLNPQFGQLLSQIFGG